MKKQLKKQNKPSKTPMQNLGAAVLRERKMRGLNQTELGDFAGTGINFIGALENGKVSLRFDKVLSVLKILGLQFRIERGTSGIIE